MKKMNLDIAMFRQKGHELIDLLADYYENVETVDFPVTIQESPQDLLAFWENDFQKEHQNDWTSHFENILKRSTQTNHPHFIGHQVGTPMPIQVLTNALLTTLNGSLAIYEMGGSGLAMEKIVADYFIEKFDWQSNNANGIFVSGGSLGNLTVLLAARQAKAGYDVWTAGNARDLAVMVSEEAHYCVSRAVQAMGLGEEGVIKIPTGDDLKILPEQLEILYQQTIQAGKTVIAVVGNACSTSTGTYDPLDVMADFCEKYDLWFHLDGAHGAPAILSEKYKYLLNGADRADSLVMDFHKMMLTPALTTLVLFKNGQTSHEAFSQKAEYLLAQIQDWHQGASRTIECTRTMKSLRAYTLLKYYGGDFIGNYITQTFDLGKYLAEKVKAHSKMELAVEPDGNIVCFRYLPESKVNIHEFNFQLRKKVIEACHFYIVQTVVKGKAFLRTTIINPLTKEKHIDAMLEEITRLAVEMDK